MARTVSSITQHFKRKKKKRKRENALFLSLTSSLFSEDGAEPGLTHAHTRQVPYTDVSIPLPENTSSKPFLKINANKKVVIVLLNILYWVKKKVTWNQKSNKGNEYISRTMCEHSSHSKRRFIFKLTILNIRKNKCLSHHTGALMTCIITNELQFVFNPFVFLSYSPPTSGFSPHPIPHGYQLSKNPHLF